MKQTISVIQIIISILLVAAIVIQAKGTGLSSTFGGSGDFYRSKRGIEKTLFILTIVLAALFLLSSVINVLV